MAPDKETKPNSDARLYSIVALSPIHIGIGEGISAINLPTAREAHTGFPLIPGSSVKGVLRQRAEEKLVGVEREFVIKAFGPPSENAGDHRGALVFSDASLVAFPVRSLWGTFAYVTAPIVLRRLIRDLEETGLDFTKFGEAAKKIGSALGADCDAIMVKESVLGETNASQVLLEDYALKVTTPDAAGVVAQWLASSVFTDKDEQTFFAQRFIVVKDDVFGFLTRNCTEVRHRVKIDEKTGTAAGSGPWTEEYLPAETILLGVVMGRVSSVSDKRVMPADAVKILKELAPQSIRIRFGGKSTVGMGQALFGLVNGTESGQGG